MVSCHPADVVVMEESLGKAVGSGVGVASRVWLAREGLGHGFFLFGTYQGLVFGTYLGCDVLLLMPPPLTIKPGGCCLGHASD